MSVEIPRIGQPESGKATIKHIDGVLDWLDAVIKNPKDEVISPPTLASIAEAAKTAEELAKAEAKAARRARRQGLVNTQAPILRQSA